MGRRKLYGVHTLSEFMALFEVCEETGCWIASNGDERGSVLKVRVLGLGKRMTASRAGYYLTTGKEVPADKVVARTCETNHCGNPDHHKVIKRGKHQKRGTKRSMTTRARIAMAMRSRSRVGMTLELAEQIRRSNETVEAIAASFGISRSLAQKIKRGRAWMPLVHGASVFSMAGR